ncbi:hypothetical protein SADO_14253 [Salinisphaera dokdonensis CL-ES53]|uniref:Transposase n=1 Tax=Salinisphaera dokdonensis CL-ES53 TaxID=1304272 RepID=A0ABV2B3J1_9GAMM
MYSCLFAPFRTQRESRQELDGTLLSYLFRLGWEHINLTGNYVRQQDE